MVEDEDEGWRIGPESVDESVEVDRSRLLVGAGLEAFGTFETLSPFLAAISRMVLILGPEPDTRIVPVVPDLSASSMAWKPDSLRMGPY